MPTLNNKVRQELLKIINEELAMVEGKAQIIASQHWRKAEEIVAQELGYGDTLTRIEFLKNQIEGLQTELNMLEGSLLEKARRATIEQYHDVGFDSVHADRYGRVYPVPKVFGREIGTLWDTLVLKKLNDSLPFLQIYEGLAQLHHVVHRELLLCGNYVEARDLYQRFHAKVMEAIGEQLPGLLTEVRKLPALQQPLRD